LTLSLAGFENASILFPVISAGTILGSLLCGRLVFGEKLKINHYIAILFGTASVVLLKL
jgi:multidrug transporter EmrE-like cation transporter